MKYSKLINLVICVSALGVAKPTLANNGLKVSATTAIVNDNNVLRKQQATSDTLLLLSPEIELTGISGKHTYTFDYKGEFSKYNNSEQLNQNEHSAEINANLDLTSKFTTEISLNFKDGAEDPGTTSASTEQLTEFNTFKNQKGKIDLIYGSKNSIGQIILGVEQSEYEYTNNLQSFRDYTSNKLTGTFFYRLAPKTRMVVQASIADLAYDDQTTDGATRNQSSKDNLYLTGIEWSTSAKITGAIKVGYQGKNHSDESYSDISGLSYLVDIAWQPSTYSNVVFSATRRTQESALINQSSFVSTGASVKLSHALSSKTLLVTFYELNSDKLKTIQGRNNNRQTFQISFGHQFTNWLSLKLSHKQIKRTSELEIYEYKAGITELSVKIELD